MDSKGKAIVQSEEKSDRVFEPVNPEEVMFFEEKKKKNILTKLFGAAKNKTEKEYEVGLVEEDDPDFYAS